jgi:hypothetical protein
MGYPRKGRADYYEPGDWNVQCYRCGMKRKAGTLKKQWQGFWVCPEHWEERQPQDFVKAVPDQMAVPWSQPLPANTFTYVCSINGQTAMPGYAVPGCMIPGYLPPSFDPSLLPGN